MGNAVRAFAFISESARLIFSSLNTAIDFSSASQSIIITDAGIGQALLLEDGFAILLETGSRLLKEQP